MVPIYTRKKWKGSLASEKGALPMEGESSTVNAELSSRKIKIENSRNFTCRKQSSALPAHQADSPFSLARRGGAGPAEEEAVIFSSGIAPVSIPRGSPPNGVKRKTIIFGGAINWFMTPKIDQPISPCIYATNQSGICENKQADHLRTGKLKIKFSHGELQKM